MTGQVERVSHLASIYALPHYVMIPFDKIEAGISLFKKTGEYGKWIESEESGSSGSYGINIDHAHDHIYVGFSDRNAAFFFKMRWR